MKKEDTSFTYEYSAQTQDEINRIRNKYLPQQEDELEQLRKLDAQAEKPGVIVALVVGLCGMVLFGLGLTCVLEWKEYFLIGIIMGIAGMLTMGCALPLHRFITKKQRAKIATQVLELSEKIGNSHR